MDFGRLVFRPEVSATPERDIHSMGSSLAAHFPGAGKARKPSNFAPAVLLVLGLLLLGMSGCAEPQQRSSFDLLAYKRELIDEHREELTARQKGIISHHPGRTFEAIDETLEKFLAENELRARAERSQYQPGAVRLFKGGPYEGGIPPELTP